MARYDQRNQRVGTQYNVIVSSPDSSEPKSREELTAEERKLLLATLATIEINGLVQEIVVSYYFQQQCVQVGDECFGQDDADTFERYEDAVESLCQKGYAELVDLGGSKMYRLTRLGLKKAKQLKAT